MSLFGRGIKKSKAHKGKVTGGISYVPFAETSAPKKRKKGLTSAQKRAKERAKRTSQRKTKRQVRRIWRKLIRT